ncbi:hypothetical protein GYMLUDRAFT_250662 [Collybiopsis luxurians FD-317 M1]|uniref:Uncharacterized protein n=1 Tax=Collybiopsis luxurians FD-317 M1 TaxID=944289 RepID=A0A0D0BTZ7_9AGAR|nr:hypothetical protein GYMLUDRAFT_250662 [Collybiopsis luxurians FD-317 M1]
MTQITPHSLQRVTAVSSSLAHHPGQDDDNNDNDGDDDEDTDDETDDPEDALTVTVTMMTRTLPPPRNPRPLIALAVKNGLLTTLLVCSFTLSRSSKRRELEGTKIGGRS